MHCAIIHYHELALKGRTREFFERQLIGNIHAERYLELRGHS